MRKENLCFALPGGRDITVPVVSVNTLIVGAGAAALKCADTLHRGGVRDLAVIVDHLGQGTSNNSGSDKQTYYKIGLFGDEPDSPMEFARTLVKGGMMHGDIAYIEALLSAPAFFDLCRIGVPFPFNKYGAYVGYKTDHDPKQRATSTGPKTSILMFKHLLHEVRRNETPIFDGHEAVKLLVVEEPSGRRVVGALCLNRQEFFRDNYGLVAINAENVVMGTGGPGEMYRMSVWPSGQLGSHGLALEIGAAAQNLTELQFGLASIGFRWNLSGSFQQVIPDYFSTDADGISGRRHFLHEYYRDMGRMATAIFLKGYQWPFHAARLSEGGSSIVDIAVHNETASGRRVFLDFTHNPVPSEAMKPFRIDELDPEARLYLERCGALQATPWERLRHMNPQSIDIYAEHGVDLRRPLEVAVCAQHCNGGMAVNPWWESAISHLFCVGELAGTHGVRPGGSALNSGQVGAMRAAQYIAAVYPGPPLPVDEFGRQVASQVTGQLAEYTRWLEADAGALEPESLRLEIQGRMSREDAFIRTPEGSRRALVEARELYRDVLGKGIRCASPLQLPRGTEDKMLALASVAFLEALVYYIEHGGGSRGGYMILDGDADLSFQGRQGTSTRYRSENTDKRKEILMVCWDGRRFGVEPVPVRPLPTDDSWFETEWNRWREGRTYHE